MVLWIERCVLWLLARVGLKVPERDPLPERRFVVDVDDRRIELLTPEGERREIALGALERVWATTDHWGPWGADLWWCLEGGGVELRLPNGATGEQALVEHLHGLPGFDGEAFSAAVRSTRVAHFPLWRRDGAGR